MKSKAHYFPLTGGSQSARIQESVNYILDLEAKGNAPVLPDFPSKLDWLNTSPLQFRKDLKGKVVLLDFWTYCCINCMHVLPDLEFLENKYKDSSFTIVGVHSAKFDNEKDLEGIRNSVLRYNINHPASRKGYVQDPVKYWTCCQRWGHAFMERTRYKFMAYICYCQSRRKLLAQIAGEGHRKDLDDFVEAVLLFYGEKKLLDKAPVPLSLEKENDPRLMKSPLKFPGKLAVDVYNNRLFISDSKHNRIVVTNLDGNYIVQVGSTGEEGLNDGSFDDAAFNRPQGLAYNPKKNLLYVADTENHALRLCYRVDIKLKIFR